MFKISYKLFESEDVEGNELNGTEGYFQFEIDNETYGIFITEEIDDFTVSVYWWLYYFLEVVRLLKTERYVLISDIEKSNIWIELKMEKDIVEISKVSADKPEGSGAIETKKVPNLTYPYWKEKRVIYEDLKKEVIDKTKLYVEELKVLNNESNKEILKMEKLVLEIEK